MTMMRAAAKDHDSAGDQQEQEEALLRRQLQSFYTFSDGDQCRCEASWENLYNAATASGGVKQGRLYNYATTQIRSNRLVTVEGVFVLSSSAPECQPGGLSRRKPPRPLSNPKEPKQRPMTTTSTSNNNHGGQTTTTQVRTQYNFNNPGGNNRRQLVVVGDGGEENDQDMDHQQEYEYDEMINNAAAVVVEKGGDENGAVDAGSITTATKEHNKEQQQQQQQRDLIRYFGTSGAAAPRTTGIARNYGVRPYGTTYGYGYGMLLFDQVSSHNHGLFFQPTHDAFCLFGFYLFIRKRQGQGKRGTTTTTSETSSSGHLSG